MSRKDIIIVAVLINAGLLVTLFISALKSEKGTAVATTQAPKEEVVVAKPATAIPSKGGDQVDQVLSQYSAKATPKEEKKEVTLPPPALVPTKKEEVKSPFKAPLEKKDRIVTVEKGDVLEKIARTHGVSVDEIMKLNSLSNTRLQIGQELKLPAKKVATQQTKKAPVDSDKYYVVKNGDNPWTIAQENNMQVEELLRLNNMDEAKAKRLRPGDRLKIK